MKNKKIFFKIYNILLAICILTIIILFILGNKTREGYLSEFKFDEYNINRTLELNGYNIDDVKKNFTINNKLNNESLTNYIFTNESITNYSYGFRIKYYSKIFRNSDIYRVYIDTNKVVENNNFIKEINMNDDGSPFGNLISTEIIDFDKIDNIKYNLKIKPVFYIILSISLIFLCIIIYLYKYIKKLIKYLYRILDNKIFISKLYLIVVICSVIIICIFYLLGKMPHEGYLSNFELIAESNLGFVYKAKFQSKDLFKVNTNRTLLLENKPDYVKNYGYSIEINRIPDWYNTSPKRGLSASIWNNEDGSFTVSNSTSVNSYNYILPLSVGEKYRTSIEIKRLSDYSEDAITYSLGNLNYNIYIPNTENITTNYEIYSRDVEIKNVSDYWNLSFFYPKGVFSIKSIKVEQTSENLYLKNGNEIIVTTSKKLDDTPYIGDIKYYIDFNYNIFIKLFVIYLVLAIILFRKEIISYVIKLNKVFNENKKFIFRIYIIFLISLIIITSIFYLLGKMPHKGYLSNFELLDSSRAGHIYKAKLISKGLFSPNFIYRYSDKPLELENKPDYIKNYGYSIEIHRMPDWYDNRNGNASVWNNKDGTFTVSNSTSWNSYLYIVPLSYGELYTIDILAKATNTNDIMVHMGVANDNVRVPIISASNDYLQFYREIQIYQIKTNIDNYLSFNFTEDVMTISHIKIYKKNENFKIYNNNEIIFTSYMLLDNNIKLNGIIYKLSISDKFKSILLIFFILNLYIYVLYSIITSIYRYCHSQIYQHISTNEYSFKQTNKKYIYFISSICFILFIFQFWLFFPGYFQYWDTLEAMNIGYFGGFHNWRPIITFLFLNFIYKIFGYNTYYLLIVNLILLYAGLFLIITPLYMKYKNRLFILLFLVPFLSVVFFNVINLEKDFTASFILFFTLSIIFFKINISNLKIRILLNIIIFILLIVSMLWRHNFIVTIYPIFISIVYDFFKVTMENKSVKNYIIKFIPYMFIIAISLIFISKQFPLLFINNNNNKEPTKYIMILHIMGCASENNDGSLIPKEWYAKDKNFEDAKNLYLNGTKLIADRFSIIWNGNAPFNLDRIDFSDIFKVYLKYITRYPIDYIKHIYNYTINMWTTSSLWINEDSDIKNKVFPYKQTIDSIQSDSGIKYWDIYKFSKYPNIKFSPIREKLYMFFYNILFEINIFIFILISIVLFILSGLILILKNNIKNSILIFTFSTAFSAVATALIVALFTPMVLYRYIYPVIPITIISLISFITFIYDRGGLKKFIQELRGKK